MLKYLIEYTIYGSIKHHTEQHFQCNFPRKMRILRKKRKRFLRPMHLGNSNGRTRNRKMDFPCL